MLIEQLKLTALTVFDQEQSFSLVSGLNVIIGGNASGKSHLLKMAFTVSKWTRRLARQEGDSQLEAGLSRDIERVFGSTSLGGLISHQRAGGKSCVQARLSDETELEIEWDKKAIKLLRPRDELGTLGVSPIEGILIPPREVLSIYPCFAQVGRSYPDLMDGASWELCCALEVEPEGAISPALQKVKAQIDVLLGGRICREHGRFYLQGGGDSKIELGLLAEGFKRLGTLGLLLENGKVTQGSMLCWDEAEMNLNISHLPALVGIIMDLCAAGVQVILTTHSLFLLRELHLSLGEDSYQSITRQFISLQNGSERGMQVESAESLEELPLLESLSAELEQADRYLTRE